MLVSDKAKYDAIVKLLVEVTVKVDHSLKACPKALIRLQVIVSSIRHRFVMTRI